MCTLMSQHMFNVHTCTHAHSPQKKHMHPCMRAYATVQKLLCRGNYCELILSFVRASCRLSFAARPAAVATKSVARHSSLKKSVQICASSWCGRRCGVTQASFDHPRWCRPHPVCLWFALETWPRGSLHQIFCLRHFSTQKKSIFWMFGVLSTIIRNGAILSTKCQICTNCPGNLTSSNTDNVDFCMRRRPYQRKAFEPSGPGPCTVEKTQFVLDKKKYLSELSAEHYFAFTDKLVTV